MKEVYYPKISIVLPVYNGQRYLRESIESVINQTFSEWELIIVNDCSTDQTQDIIAEYAEQDNRITYIINEINCKLPQSLNIGFENAHGKYLTWTSDDNRYRENALEVMSRFLDDNLAVTMVYAGMMNIDERGKELWLQEEVTDDELFLRNTIGACFMYRREIIAKVGAYDTELFGVEDYDYWLRIAQQGCIMRIKPVLYDYRHHGDSLTYAKKEMVRKQFLKLRKKHIGWILERCKNNYNMLCRLFFDYVNLGRPDKEIENRIQCLFPYLKYWKSGFIETSVLVFGAGEIGKKVAKMLGRRVVAFTDNDCKKVGMCIDGLSVLSFSEAQSRSEPFVIAISKQYIHELILQLAESQCERAFYVYPYFKE